MKIILLEPIKNFGELGEEVTVKRGFARNYLLPQRKAVRATAENRKVFEQRRAELQKIAADRLAAAEDRARRLAETSLTIVARTGDEGRLYGSVGAQEIVRALAEQGMEVHKREVVLDDGPMRMVGDYQVTLHLHSDLSVTIPVSVVAE